MKLSELLESVATRSVNGSMGVTVNAIQYDSRKVGAGDVFVAVRGEKVDGHKFIDAAVRQGAVAVVVEDETVVKQGSLAFTVVTVENSRVALAQCAHSFYRFPTRRVTVVGITGTNGKTTTSHIVRHVLGHSGRPAGMIGTIEYGFGTMTPATHTTPESVDLCSMIDTMINDGATAVVMEVSSHALALQRVNGFSFAAAAFTNLTQDHLDFHVTMEQYASAKSELFRMLAENAVAVVNADDAYAPLMTQSTRAAVVRYGLSPECAVRAEKVTFGLNGTEFLLTLHGAHYNVVSPYLGMFNVYNLLAGIAVAAGLGIHDKEIVAAIPTLPQVRGRLERIPLANGAIAIVDYAHTPDALQRAIETVRVLVNQSKGRVITLFGCGGDRDTSKRPIMGATAATLSDEVYVTSDNPRTEQPGAIIADILTGIPRPQRVHVVEDRGSAIEQALAASQSGDVVLLAGKGHETYQIVGSEKLPFDDAAYARSWAAGATAQC